jgi:hypothetical protein
MESVTLALLSLVTVTAVSSTLLLVELKDTRERLRAFTVMVRSMTGSQAEKKVFREEQITNWMGLFSVVFLGIIKSARRLIERT